MTLEEIYKLEAGAELDAIVARNVMGWERHVRDTIFWVDAAAANNVGCLNVRGELGKWSPSTDIAAAWEVVAKLRADDWLVVVKEMPEAASFIIPGSRSEYDAPCPDRPFGKGMCCCEVQDMRDIRDKNAPWRRDAFAMEQTTPLAICRVALKAILE